MCVPRTSQPGAGSSRRIHAYRRSVAGCQTLSRLIWITFKRLPCMPTSSRSPSKASRRASSRYRANAAITSSIDSWLRGLVLGPVLLSIQGLESQLSSLATCCHALRPTSDSPTSGIDCSAGYPQASSSRTRLGRRIGRSKPDVSRCC